MCIQKDNDHLKAFFFFSNFLFTKSNVENVKLSLTHKSNLTKSISAAFHQISGPNGQTSVTFKTNPWMWRWPARHDDLKHPISKPAETTKSWIHAVSVFSSTEKGWLINCSICEKKLPRRNVKTYARTKKKQKNRGNSVFTKKMCSFEADISKREEKCFYSKALWIIDVQGVPSAVFIYKNGHFFVQTDWTAVSKHRSV